MDEIGSITPRPGVPSDGDTCGRELDGPDLCGKPAVVWVTFDGAEWDDTVATACDEHADELLAYNHRVSSDAPLYADDPR